MIREYFPAQHKFHFGFPGGNVEGKHGSPLSATQAELEEEAGLYGGEWFPLLDVGRAAPQDKYQEDCLYMYLVVDSQVKETETSTDLEEIITIEHEVPISVVHDRIYKGELQANGIATFLLGLRHLKLLGYPV
uniref:Nudix hydrolase domain-containing protein n=1 Tax=Rhodosorus marinus TaxID=101924 RepID=A0A7S0G5W5_9RHOD|mmetsp:Transcript_24553/g.35422  ORF Transcript_24553/g.35422 Transcript_24553/m.35422 type:complete len:133 (+) Transcript_24553:92-490(+)